ncbi:hypothetical protein LXA43DRAFT_895643 [Ganoderma leucocontextum]|nr:hypothetical protein LXA43DRAFT_895643 [Ganoderma leucocontextum]
MERTFSASFCRSTNLLVALGDPSFPNFLRPLVPLIHDFGDPLHESLHSIALSQAYSTECVSPLPQDIYHALFRRLHAEPRLSDYTYYCSTQSAVNPGIPVLNPNAQLLPDITYMGRRFTTANRSIGDSNIMFHARSFADTQAFGQIQLIFEHKRSIRGGEFRHEVFLAIKSYQPLAKMDIHLDPYDAFEGLSTKLVRTELDSHIQVIPLNDMVRVCHVVMCPFRSTAPNCQLTYSCSVVVALDEVGFIKLSSVMACN